MISLKKKQSGFTIVELLIVIVVIGILALLVVNTFSGIQKKARDSERQTDINALHGQLEAYYAQNAKYPSLVNLQTSTWVSSNLKGLDPKALLDPNQTTAVIQGSNAANQYGYVATPANCDNSTTDCTAYALTATLESGSTFAKNSLN